MTYNVIHRTIYDYASSVTVSHHAARVQPRTLAYQQVAQFSLTVAPAPSIAQPRRDFFGNHV